MELISTKEAAEILGLTPRRLRQLRDDLGAVEIGGALCFPRKRIEAEAKKDRPNRGPKPKGNRQAARKGKK